MKFRYETYLPNGSPALVSLTVDDHIMDPDDMLFALSILDRMVAIDRKRAYTLQAIRLQQNNAPEDAPEAIDEPSPASTNAGATA